KRVWVVESGAHVGASRHARTGIAHYVSKRPTTHTVGHTRRIGEIGPIHYAERGSCLKADEARHLPASQSDMRSSGLSEDWQVVLVANVEDVALIEVRAGTRGL